MKPREDTDELSFRICARLKEYFDEVSTTHSLYGNIIGAFFHDLVIHFTGIVIHRNTIKDYGSTVQFPWVNKRYALDPSLIEEGFLLPPKKNTGIAEAVKSVGLIPVAAGQSIPLGHGQQRHLEMVLKTVLAHPRWMQVFLPDRASQLALLEQLVLELCKDYGINKSDIVRQNWKRFAQLHTTDKQESIREKGVLVGARNNLHNRKLALNFLQQGKEVVGFTHGEISNHVLDEPVYAYSDKTLCTTLVDYGSFQPNTVSFPPIIEPATEKRRSSPIVKKLYRRSETIEYRDLRKTRNLFIPTIYQQNYLYGPKHVYETDQYYRWHRAIEDCVPNLTIKMHPKTRFHPAFTCNVDYRQLADCVEDYDVLMFDFFATAAVLTIFSDKPVIYFDIGLRSLDPQFRSGLENRCTVVEVDFFRDWEEQIQVGLNQYENAQRTCSNIDLAKYSLCDLEEFSLSDTIFDIMRGT